MWVCFVVKCILFSWPAFCNFLSDTDGLMDCVDPDCCEQLSCGSDPLCHGSADPLALLQQSPLPPTTLPSPTSAHTHSFYYRIRFLLGKTATHTLPGEVPFDTRYMWVDSLFVLFCVCACVRACTVRVRANSLICLFCVCVSLSCPVLKDINCI